MENSIFSGLTPANIRIAFEQAKNSPEALGAVLIVVVVMIAAIAFAGALAAKHIGGFYARIQEEDEKAREEEEAEEAAKLFAAQAEASKALNEAEREAK